MNDGAGRSITDGLTGVSHSHVESVRCGDDCDDDGCGESGDETVGIVIPKTDGSNTTVSSVSCNIANVFPTNLFNADNVQLPPSILNLIADYQYLPTPPSLSNIFQDSAPTHDWSGMVTKSIRLLYSIILFCSDLTGIACPTITLNDENSDTTTHSPTSEVLDLSMIREKESESTIKMRMMPFNMSTQINCRPYPPTNMVGPISEHDRPFAKYGQMKEYILMEIYRQFELPNLQYICISTDSSPSSTTSATTTAINSSTMYLQIVLKEVANKNTWFLDEVTGDQCNYHVTNNDLAWNEFIKKGRVFIEIGLFKSNRVRTCPGDWSSSEFVRAKQHH
ncbi:unnamed protein product [Rotaria sp. Silwood1]|nr:unnamed protein product [Rotaria sp. Silwood1]CAF4887609.1 unnamed protein product [Rotaria sp. Silwood1]